MITTTELEKIAVDLIERENKTDWHYEVGVPEHREGSIWVVLVRWISPDGDPLDGPGVIHIDEERRAAWFIDTC